MKHFIDSTWLPSRKASSLVRHTHLPANSDCLPQGIREYLQEDKDRARKTLKNWPFSRPLTPQVEAEQDYPDTAVDLVMPMWPQCLDTDYTIYASQWPTEVPKVSPRNYSSCSKKLDSALHEEVPAKTASPSSENRGWLALPRHIWQLSHAVPRPFKNKSEE